MAPSARVKAAFKAMKNIGIGEEKTKPALKKLLKVFDKNWDLIEEENYRVLADAIFEYEESETAEQEKKKSENTERGEASGAVPWQDGPMQDETMPDEPERPLKRLRLKHQGQDAPSNGQPSPTPGVGALKIPKPEPGEPEASAGQRAQPVSSPSRRAQPVAPQPLVRNKGKQVASSHNTGASTGRVQPPAAPEREKRAASQAPGTAASGRQMPPQINALIKPKDEPFTDDLVSVEPLAVVLPGRTSKEGPSKPANGIQDDQRSETEDGRDKATEAMASTAKEKHLQAIDVSERPPAKVDIAASSLGEVKISLNCYPGSNGHEMHVPDLEAVLKKVNDNCLKTYKIMNPEFSVTKVMREFCECVVDLGKKADGANPEDLKDQNALVVNNNGALNSSLNGEPAEDMAVATERTLPDESSSPLANAAEDNSAERDGSGVELNLKSIVVTRPYDTNDITGGEEAVTVSLEKSNCEFLPSFHYISKNVISDNAEVKFSLAQVRDKDCCLSCLGDCISLSSSCNCTHNNGGGSPYTLDGLVSEEFLDECISMVRNPQGHHLMYCKECPLERLKSEDMLDPCKGHLKRKFIKECCIRCDCTRYCGNRVVQRGIQCNLQVFWTSEGKGWGLRTLDDLPKGAFVCEFVGEILTCVELHKRNLSRSNDKHSFSLLLDTDWGTRALKEEEFLCLDGTFYGNVARFINHRCTDANLIEIPVEVETPSHHYYHVALFTTRKVNAFEELTWDYGVDFDDSDQHIKAFRCLCGSQFCRNMKRSSRSRSALTLQ